MIIAMSIVHVELGGVYTGSVVFLGNAVCLNGTSFAGFDNMQNLHSDNIIDCTELKMYKAGLSYVWTLLMQNTKHSGTDSSFNVRAPTINESQIQLNAFKTTPLVIISITR